jgi:dihydropyrimidine dehydrogenase (NAD+) subunit PreA
MWRGFNVVQEMMNGLAGFMDRKGYKTLEEFKGVALKHFVEDHLTMDVTSKIISVIDGTKCTGCRLCVTACDEGAYSAITMKNDVAVSDRTTCTGCGLCGIVCPVQDCITYTRIPSRQQ